MSRSRKEATRFAADRRSTSDESHRGLWKDAAAAVTLTRARVLMRVLSLGEAARDRVPQEIESRRRVLANVVDEEKSSDDRYDRSLREILLSGVFLSVFFIGRYSVFKRNLSDAKSKHSRYT